jgi:hypothetical protein
MKKYITGAAVAALVATPLSAVAAQETAAVQAPAATATVETPVTAASADTGLLTLAVGTPITLAVAQEVNSSTHHAGDVFQLTVLNDVRVGDTVVIPRGTPAQAEITWRTGKGAFGKSGKLEFSLRYIDLGGQHIPVSGAYRQEGEGNTVATGVGMIAAGVIGGLVITGHRARLPMGREVMAQLAQPVPFTADGHLGSSFNAQAAMATAEAATPIGQCRTQAAALTNERQRTRAQRACFRERLD